MSKRDYGDGGIDERGPDHWRLRWRESRLGLRGWAHSVADKLGENLVDRERERE